MVATILRELFLYSAAWYGDFQKVRLHSATRPLSMLRVRATKPGRHYDRICEISRHVPVGIGNGHGRNAVDIPVTLLRLLDLDCGIRSDAYHSLRS